MRSSGAMADPRMVENGVSPWPASSTSRSSTRHSSPRLGQERGLDFTIPYQHQGVAHQFKPDFVGVLRDASGAASDEHLIIEVKGMEREQDRSKEVGAARWRDAVNH